MVASQVPGVEEREESILEQDHLPGKSERSLGGIAGEQKWGPEGDLPSLPKAHYVRCPHWEGGPGRAGGLKTSSETHLTLRALNKPVDGQTGMADYLEQTWGRTGGVWEIRTRRRKRCLFPTSPFGLPTSKARQAARHEVN